MPFSRLLYGAHQETNRRPAPSIERERQAAERAFLEEWYDNISIEENHPMLWAEE